MGSLGGAEARIDRERELEIGKGNGERVAEKTVSSLRRVSLGVK
jgi:hypothetical protein